jgi:hypothetical protein
MHVLFDYGAIGIADDLTILGLGGDLELDPGHELSLEAIQPKAPFGDSSFQL